MQTHYCIDENNCPVSRAKEITVAGGEGGVGYVYRRPQKSQRSIFWTSRLIASPKAFMSLIKSSCFCAHILCVVLHKNAVNGLPVGSATTKCECKRLLCLARVKWTKFTLDMNAHFFQ